MRRPLYRDREASLRDGLAQYENLRGALPGIAEADRRSTLVAQMISSLRRVEYVTAIRNRPIDEGRCDPLSSIFDPLRAAASHARAGRLDEAVWSTFIATHFGKHIHDGWKLAANVFGSFGQGPIWTAERYTASPEAFEEMLARRRGELRDFSVSGRFSNHRQYQSKNPDVIGTVFRTWHAWQFANGGMDEKVRAIHRAHGQRPEEVFDVLYKSMRRVYGFGRLGSFDMLTMLGKLQLAPISPGSVYLVGATGPLRGARLLFCNDPTARDRAPILERSVDELDEHLSVGKQVLEDSLCNWQKSPSIYVYFDG